MILLLSLAFSFVGFLIVVYALIIAGQLKGRNPLKKPIITGVLVLLSLFSMTSCDRVEPNKEGVLMSNYGRNGKEDFKTVTGSQFTLFSPGTELYQVPMWQQTADPAAIGITARDGGYFKVDPTYTYEPVRGKGTDIVFAYKHIGLSGIEDNALMDKIEASVLNALVTNAYREEARNYPTDSLLNNVGGFEKQVEARLDKEFETKYFHLTNLTSGLQPPQSMVEAIEARNNRKLEVENVENQLAIARKLQEKATIEAQTHRIEAAGLPKEILQARFIEAIRTSQNRIIITDGKASNLISTN